MFVFEKERKFKIGTLWDYIKGLYINVADPEAKDGVDGELAYTDEDLADPDRAAIWIEPLDPTDLDDFKVAVKIEGETNLFGNLYLNSEAIVPGGAVSDVIYDSASLVVDKVAQLSALANRVEVAADIDIEKQRAITAESQNANDIITVDTKLDNEITRLDNYVIVVTSEGNAIKQAITNEVTRATTAESAVETRVSNLETGATPVAQATAAKDIVAGGTIESSINAKQDTLTATQLISVNSGIDSQGVIQITTNKNAIDALTLTVADKQDIIIPKDGLEFESDNKTLKHSNVVTAQTSSKLGAITFDSQGHITGFVEKAVVNDLTSTATDQPLAASQGKALSDMVAASANIKIVATLPTTPTANTIYYVGTTSPYQVYFYDSSSTQYDMGTTSVNLTDYAKKSYVDSEANALQTQINAKQDALSTTQLSSLNSGIDSAKVTQIDTNTTDIATLTTTVAGKQDALPTVVNDRFLHTNATTGALEWSSVAAGVKVDGVDTSDILTSTAHPYSSTNRVATLGDISAAGGGTVTSITAGTGLTGGTITTSGTIAVDTAVIQEKLIAGTNITISSDGKTISATGGGVKVDGTDTTDILTSVSNPYSATNRLATMSDISAAGGGTVTQVSAGPGLTGGPITASGTLDHKAYTATAASAKKIGNDAYGHVVYGSALALSDLGVTASSAEVNYTTGVTSAIQTQLDSKQATMSAGTGISITSNTINHSNSVTAQTTQKMGTVAFDAQGHITGFTEKAIVNNLTSTATDQPLAAAQGKTLSDAIGAAGNIKVVSAKPSSPTANTLYYVGTASPYEVWFYDSASTWYDMGTTEISLSDYRKSADQDTIDSGKQDKLAATGSATNPVYVSGAGTVSACTYELNKTVPSDAVFTDTTYAAGEHISITGTTNAISVVSTPYTTTEPTAANTDGIKFVVLSSEPTTKYAGWIYFITA